MQLQAEMPGVAVLVRNAAENQMFRGVVVLSRTVPAVTDTWGRQATHLPEQPLSRLIAWLDPHAGPWKPSGHRDANR